MDAYFSMGTAAAVREYLWKAYGVRPEFLWEKFPNNAVLRHPGTGKWFGTLISLPRSRLKLSGSGAVEIINLKCGPHLTGALIDGRRYLPAYHMNKEHWVAVLLDGTVATEEICRLADLSFALVAGTLS